MTKLSAGKEVLSFCKKCALNLTHTIVVMKDENTIYKVECKTCKNTHVYRDPSSVSAKRSTRSPSTKKGPSASKKRSSSSVSDMWLEAVGKFQGKSRAYSVKGKFEVGEIVDHPKFGPGIIDRTIDADKIEVIFRHDIKTLVHNK